MLGEVLILGAGVSGSSVLEYLTAPGASKASSYTLVGGKKSPSWKQLPHTSASANGTTSIDATASATTNTNATASASGRIVLGTDEIPDPLHGKKYDIAIVSPGISPYSEIFQAAQKKSKHLVSEVEFAFLELPIRWIGVTGTNGKTTTTTLIAHTLNAVGIEAIAAGNIGLPLTSLAAQYKEQLNEVEKRAARERKPKREGGELSHAFSEGHRNESASAATDLKCNENGTDEFPWIVAELSSYQLENTYAFHPKIACLLNVAPDHLSWHNGFDNYRAAKRKIFQNLEKTDVCVIDVDDENTQEIARDLRSEGKTIIPVSSRPTKAFKNFYEDDFGNTPFVNAAFLDEKTKHLTLVLNEKSYDLGAVKDLPLKGEHNVKNVLCAAVVVAVAMRMSLPWEKRSPQDVAHVISKAMKSCPALPHRVEEVDTIDGTTYINDSKATNFASTLVALQTFSGESKVLLLGGKDKGIETTNDFLRALGDECKAIICFGEAGPRLQAEISAFFEKEEGTTKKEKRKNKLEILEVKNLEEAVAIGQKWAKRLDASYVLLSPGCSSFDEFGSFEERGDTFRELVYELKGRSTQEAKSKKERGIKL